MVSIIVPVYNVEKYLKKAVESVINQTYPDWELILVDDGSTDSCPEICRQYERQDQRIQAVTKENGGVSSARNVGLKRARGEWICFLDGDDWLEERCLETALKETSKDVDIVCWNYWKNTQDSQQKNAPIIPQRIVADDPAQLARVVMFPQYALKTAGKSFSAIKGVWTKLIRRSIISENRLTFNEQVQIGEDGLFGAQCFEKAGKAVFVNEYLYHYRMDNESATRSCRPDIKDVYSNTLNAFKVLADRYGDPETRLCYGGLTYACVARSTEKYYFHHKNTLPLKKKLRALKKYLGEEQIQYGVSGITDSRIFYMKQRLVIFCIRHKSALGLYILSVMKQRMNRKRCDGGNL